MDLSIIVPVYNVEKYIRPCIESIFKQGLDDDVFEVIIINDGTKDHSMEMIADIIAQHNNIIVINQENQGLSVARNNGIAIAKGEYIYMLDSDDLLINNRLKPILEAALTAKVDIVIADFIQMGDSEIEVFLKYEQQNHSPILRFEETTGKDLLDESLCRYYWRNLYRKEFLETNNISFIPGITAQDIPFTNECLLKANKCLRIEWPIIIYRWGHESTTNSIYNIKKAKDLSTAIAHIWKLANMDGLSVDTRKKQMDIVFRYFYSYVCKISYGHIKGFTQITEAIDYIKQVAPDMKFNNNFKQRLWTFMYQKTPHTLVKLKFYLTSLRRWKNRIDE